MDKVTRKQIENFVQEHIGKFHQARLKSITGLRLSAVLRRKNPYLFRAKNVTRADSFVEGLLQAALSSSEETRFGSFLEELALFVAEITSGGRKSSTEGIDIDLTKDNIRYLIAVKSGDKWGNSTSRKKQDQYFRTAVMVLKGSKQVGEIQPTLGICYGNFPTAFTENHLHIGGQSFWHLLSGDPELYVDIIEPLGFEAEQHDKRFTEARDATFNRLVREFTTSYCDKSGEINWTALVGFISKNMPEDILL